MRPRTPSSTEPEADALPSGDTHSAAGDYPQHLRNEAVRTYSNYNNQAVRYPRKPGPNRNDK